MTTTLHLLDLDNLALGLIILHTIDDAPCMALVCLHVCKRINGLVGKIQWPSDPTDLYKYPAANGHTLLIYWLRKVLHTPWDTWVCNWAAQHGQLKTLIALREQTTPWYMRPFVASTRAPWDAWACSLAAMGGHMETIKWMRANGAPWNTQACAWAALKGHFNIVVWLIVNRAPWNKQECIDNARAAGHIRIAKWLARLRV